MAWQRYRSPEDVPSSVAVAVADFCRRAQAAATPGEVREALSTLSSEDDFRVQRVTDGEPSTGPLGPFAVVDMVRGARADVAATRQQCGYYELVREFLARTKETPVKAPVVSQPSPPRAEPRPLPREKSHPALRLSEKIAPRKRTPVVAPPSPGALRQGVLEPVPESRELPAPRGRFARLSEPKQPARHLFMADGKLVLSQHLEQFGNRFAAFEALSQKYEGRGKTPLTMAEFEDALRRHSLWDALARQERERLVACFAEHQGAEGRVAWAMGVSLPSLRQMVKSAGLEGHVRELREKRVLELLSEPSLAHRVEMAGRTRYLEDLGILKPYLDKLKADLTRILEEARPGCDDWASLLQSVALRQGIREEILARSLDRLNLTATFQRRLAEH